MRSESSGLSALIALVVVIVVFGGLLALNAQPAPSVQVIFPTPLPPTDESSAWQGILREGFGSNSTPLPTVAIPTVQFIPPTLPVQAAASSTPVAADDFEVEETPFEIAFASTPTRPAPTPTLLSTDVPVTVVSVTRPPSDWQPPPLVPPISRDPYGRDHYWFSRPVDSTAANYGLPYYQYGTDGNEENPLIVHHGIDMANPIGEPVRAAGSGTVIWAADGLRTDDGVFENSPAYGNVVVIEHDFGYRGKKLYTLYAHLSAAYVVRDQTVSSGDLIGLIGNTGRVTGPHVHFEVRMIETSLNRSSYSTTYNPVLWMVPYVGHGVIAGRVIDQNGRLIEDADITIRNYSNGLVEESSTTYIFQDTGFDVNPDPIWQENFAVGDIPTGRYEVIATFDGYRVSEVIDVLEGTTSFVELSPIIPATPQDIVTPAETPAS